MVSHISNLSDTNVHFYLISTQVGMQTIGQHDIVLQIISDTE